MPQATLADFLPRYPEFNCVDRNVINSTLADAALYTDGTWGEAELLGSMLYTAHSLTIRGLGEGAASAAFKNSHIKSRSSGSHKIEYNSVSRSGISEFVVKSPYLSTVYGKQFLDLLNRNSAGILSVL